MSPLGLSGVVLAHWLIPNSRSNQKSPFDWIGFTLTSAACVSLMYGLDLIGRHESNWLTSGLLLVCSLAIGVSAVWHVRRHPHPLIDLSSLRVPTFAVTIWGGSLFRIAIGATPFAFWPCTPATLASGIDCLACRANFCSGEPRIPPVQTRLTH